MKKMTSVIKDTINRQTANYERFMQGKAGVFQVTGQKEQAMFWVLSPTVRQ